MKWFFINHYPIELKFLRWNRPQRHRFVCDKTKWKVESILWKVSGSWIWRTSV